MKTNDSLNCSFAFGVGLAIALLPFPALARTCRPVPPAPPSPETREFRNDQLGIALAIPSNYRSMLRNTGHISFHDPNSFEYIQCLVRAGEYGTVPPYAALEIHPGLGSNRDLVKIVRVKRPWLDFYSPNYVPGEFAGRPAIQYEYTNEIYRLAIANISFLSADGQTLLTVTGPKDNPILQAALVNLVVGTEQP